VGRGAKTGPDNHNWKGGRSVASNGYILVRVGVEHPMADVRGYAYEHRLIAQASAGRVLRDDEHVHHINEDKSDNRPENLEIVTFAEHRLRHRTADRGLRLPGEDNATVACACGCGATFDRYDANGRPRVYISGHNPGQAPARDAVMGALGSGPRTVAELVAATGSSARAVRVLVSKLARQRVICRVSHGVYAEKAV